MQVYVNKKVKQYCIFFFSSTPQSSFLSVVSHHFAKKELISLFYMIKTSKDFSIHRMSEDKNEITKDKVCPKLDETIAKQAVEFLHDHGKREMAMMIKTLLDNYGKTSKEETEVEDAS